jgi:signal transduction histidine kinase
VRVTFDSNVFVSALNYQGPPAVLLELAAVDAFRLQLSAEILDETMRILAKKFGWSAEDITEASAVLYQPPDCSNIDVGVFRSGECARVAVRDYGPGVPDHALSKIFNPFFRVDDSRNSKTGGVGLGLAIASRALQLHNGTIVASNASPGLLITMDFPVAGPVRRDIGDSRDYSIPVERESE